MSDETGVVLGRKKKMSFRCARLPANLLVVLLMQSAGTIESPAMAADPLKDRFLSEAPRKWQEYRSHSTRFQGSVMDTTVDLEAGGKVIDQMLVEFKQNRASGCTLAAARFFVPKQRRPQVDAINFQYEFTLNRRDSLAPWAIINTEMITSGDSSSRDCMSNRALEYWPQVGLLFHQTYDLLPYLLKQPDFSIKAVTPVMVPSSQLAKVEFEYQPKETGGDISPLRAGWVLLDPERYWLVVKFEAQVDAPGAYKGLIVGSMEYEQDEEVPIAKKRVFEQKRTYADGTKGHYETRFEFQIAEADVEESDFYLSAFGLPEPISASVRPTRWYLWALLAAGVSLVLAFLLRRHAKRRDWTLSRANRI
jgi:hypothetical protein